MLLPCENNELKTRTLERPQLKCPHLPCYINGALIAIIEGELSLQRALDNLKRWLHQYSDYSVEGTFGEIAGIDIKVLEMT